MESILDCSKETVVETEETALIDIVEEAQVEPEKVMRDKCIFCGCVRREGLEFFDREYCSGRCKAADSENRKPGAGDCLYCGNKRKEGIAWFDGDYCSGKCKKLDGGYVEPALPQDIYLSAGHAKAKEEYDNLLETLQQKKLDRDNADKDSLNMKDSQFAKMAQGDSESADKLQCDFQAALDRRNKLDEDIELLTNRVIPNKLREIDAAVVASHKKAKDETLARKADHASKFQEGINLCAAALKDWCEDMKASKASYNKNEESLTGSIVITDVLREALTPRIKGKRIAKLSAEQPEPKAVEVLKIREGKKCKTCGTKKKANVPWPDKDFCSGRCKGQYDD